MHIPTAPGRAAWSAVVADPRSTLVCTDFDGVLAPIVDDPEAAWASEDVMDALGLIGARVGKVAVVTGRPARTVVRLGRLHERAGLRALTVLGLYGCERWDAATGEYTEPDAPPTIAAAAAELPALLEEVGLTGARVEDKRLSLGVHTRELAHPAAALERLREPLADLAARHGLEVQPGRYVLELRASGQDKGGAVRRLVGESRARTVVYAGDDLGDVPAFEAVRDLRGRGVVDGLLVCSGSTEQDALVGLADVVVPGPPGVAALFRALAGDRIYHDPSVPRKEAP